VNNVAAKQGQLVSLGPILGQFLASVIAPEHPGSLLARTGVRWLLRQGLTRTVHLPKP